jgi:hypothetical protein
VLAGAPEGPGAGGWSDRPGRDTGNSVCLENMLTEQLRDFTPAVSERHKWDRVVFAGESIVAFIRRAPDGSAIMNRFDS